MRSLNQFSRIAIVPVVFLAIAFLCTPNAFAQLSVSPSVLVFPNTPVGPDCAGANCSYAEVTITNNGTETEQIVTADPTQPTLTVPFWATFGGTCNLNNYYIDPGQSCTFQWGFKPVHPGRALGVGTISFLSGASVGVVLTGRGIRN